MIQDHKKEEVRQAADIVEVIGSYVKLRRSGGNFSGLCPFHNEKSPSFNVNPKLGIFKCFGCGAGGDVFQFVMQMDGVGFNEAIRSLAERYNVDLPAEEDHAASDPEYQRKEGVYHALRFAGAYYHTTLNDTEEAEAARQYLSKRSFSRETIRKAGIGYAPNGNDALYRAATQSGIKTEYLMDAGLVRSDENGTRYYDYFRGRLIFPIFNPSGKVIAFAGRILGQEKTAKYINSPQTIVYNKSEVLYGIHMARNEIRKSGIAFLVEGYTDVLSLYQAGVRNAVASSGTALTAEQVRLLHRYGEVLLMIYDSDAAGQAAMLRGMDIAVAEGFEVRMLELPEGEDPDSFVRQFGSDAFNNFTHKESRDFLSFLIEKARTSGAWDEPGRKQKSVSRMLRSIALMKEPVKREAYVQFLSRESGIGDRSLFEELGQLIGRNNRSAEKEQKIAQRPRAAGSEQGSGGIQYTPDNAVAGQRSAAEKELLRVMVTYGNPIVEFVGMHSNADHFRDAEYRHFYENMLGVWESGAQVNQRLYLDGDPKYASLISEMLVERHSVSEKSAKRGGEVVKRDPNPYAAARSALRALKLEYLERIRLQNEQLLRDPSAVESADVEKAKGLIHAVAAEKKRMQTSPLEDLFGGAPQAGNHVQNEPANPYRVEDFIGKKKGR